MSEADDTYLLDRGGTILLGRYRVQELIGTGGMGSVWVVEQLVLKQTAVVKFHESWSSREHSETAIARFVEEARLLAAVHHRNVTRLYEVGRTEDGEPFLIMERLRGDSLAWRMRDGLPMPVRESTEIAIAIAAGLEAVHAGGVYHRDVKPENVFLHEDEDLDQIVPKLLDFGLAGWANASSESNTGYTVGTPGYMPPEQAYGLENIDHRVDVYALGVTLYEMLTARLPAEGDTGADLMHSVVHFDPLPITSYRANLPPDLAELIMRTVSRNREERPQNARALRHALQDTLR